MWLFCITLVTYFALHSVFASSQVKTALYGLISQSYYRLFYNLFAIITLWPVWYFYQKASKVTLVPLPYWVNLIGIFGFLLGIFLLFLSLRQYDGTEFSGLAQLKSSSKPVHTSLNTKGFNAWVRHPLYFSSLILIWSAFLYAPKSVHAVGAIITTIYVYIGAWLEEQKLRDYFGESYAQYQHRVPMLIPIKWMDRSK